MSTMDTIFIIFLVVIFILGIIINGYFTYLFPSNKKKKLTNDIKIDKMKL